jgi:hypothetical protein
VASFTPICHRDVGKLSMNNISKVHIKVPIFFLNNLFSYSQYMVLVCHKKVNYSIPLCFTQSFRNTKKCLVCVTQYTSNQWLKKLYFNPILAREGQIYSTKPKTLHFGQKYN